MLKLNVQTPLLCGFIHKLDLPLQTTWPRQRYRVHLIGSLWFYRSGAEHRHPRAQTAARRTVGPCARCILVHSNFTPVSCSSGAMSCTTAEDRTLMESCPWTHKPSTRLHWKKKGKQKKTPDMCFQHSDNDFSVFGAECLLNPRTPLLPHGNDLHSNLGPNLVLLKGC